MGFKHVIWFLLCGIIVGNNLSGQPLFWQSLYGGSGYDMGKQVLIKKDGTIVVAGDIYSKNKWGVDNHGPVGTSDVLIFRFATQGITFWQQTLGGSGYDEVAKLIETRDGGVAFIGNSESKDGTLSFNQGGSDVWVVKLTDKGKVEWSKSFGGKGNDRGLAILELEDGGYLIAGESASDEGDMRSMHHGGLDSWIAKLDRNGKLIWERHYGGTHNEYACGIHPLPNYRYLIVNASDSFDGDVTQNMGKKDAWIFIIDEYGKMQSQDNVGGEGIDEVHGSCMNEKGEIYVVGTTFSTRGDIPRQWGKGDCWLFKLNQEGKIVWSNVFGGRKQDGANDVYPTADGGVIFCGMSQSGFPPRNIDPEDINPDRLIDGDIILNNGYYDALIVKVNAFGMREWTRNFGLEGRDSFHGVVQTPIGGYLALGFLDQPTMGNPTPGRAAGNTTVAPRHHGGFDFWLCNIGELNQPGVKPYVTPPLLRGLVKNKETGQPVQAAISLIDNQSLATQVSANADPVDGKFDMMLPVYGLSSLKILAKGYLFYGEDLLLDTMVLKNSITRKIELSPIRVGSSLILNNIYFDPGRWELLDRSRAELERLVEFLELNPKVRIQISGHTDNTGNRSQKQTLSLYRANAVRDYLISKGIAAVRLSTKGFGMLKPIASNRSRQGRRKNRRVEFSVVRM